MEGTEVGDGGYRGGGWGVQRWGMGGTEVGDGGYRGGGWRVQRWGMGGTEVGDGGYRKRPPYASFFLWYGGSCSSKIVLTVSLIYRLVQRYITCHFDLLTHVKPIKAMVEIHAPFCYIIELVLLDQLGIYTHKPVLFMHIKPVKFTPAST